MSDSMQSLTARCSECDETITVSTTGTYGNMLTMIKSLGWSGFGLTWQCPSKHKQAKPVKKKGKKVKQNIVQFDKKKEKQKDVKKWQQDRIAVHKELKAFVTEPMTCTDP